MYLAESNMERSKNKFIEAHWTTMEVLKVAAEVEISTERFSKKWEEISVSFLYYEIWSIKFMEVLHIDVSLD